MWWTTTCLWQQLDFAWTTARLCVNNSSSSAGQRFVFGWTTAHLWVDSSKLSAGQQLVSFKLSVQQLFLGCAAACPWMYNILSLGGQLFLCWALNRHWVARSMSSVACGSSLGGQQLDLDGESQCNTMLEVLECARKAHECP